MNLVRVDEVVDYVAQFAHLDAAVLHTGVAVALGVFLVLGGLASLVFVGRALRSVGSAVLRVGGGVADGLRTSLKGVRLAYFLLIVGAALYSFSGGGVAGAAHGAGVGAIISAVMIIISKLYESS